MTVISDASPLHYLVLIATVGTLGILSMAAEKKMVSLEKAFAALQQTSFRVRPSLLAALLTHHQTCSDN